MGVTEGDLYGVAGVFEGSVETRSGMAGVFEGSVETGSGCDGRRPLRGGWRRVKTSLIVGARVMLQTLVGTSLMNRRR